MFENCNDLYIMSKVQEHYDYAKNLGYTVLGAFAYGSMNYGYFVDGQSDVDTKIIVIPDMFDTLFCQPVSKEYHLPDKSHMEVKDIREMLKMYWKGNINFVETLYTHYKILNPAFEKDFIMNFIIHRGAIANYNQHHAIASIVGQTKHTLKQFINEDVKDPKKLHNVARLIYFLEEYIGGTEYSKCLATTDKNMHDSLLELKLKLSPHWQKLVKAYENELNIIEKYNSEHPTPANEELKRTMEFKVMHMIKKYWREK